MRNIGKAIAKIRIIRGISASVIAKAACVDLEQLYRIESGRSSLHVCVLFDVSEALRVALPVLAYLATTPDVLDDLNTTKLEQLNDSFVAMLCELGSSVAEQQRLF